MRIAFKLAGTAVALALAGCSSLNPFASKAEPRNPPAALVAFNPSMAIRTAWTASVGSMGNFAFSPVFASGSIFAAAADGTVTRLDAASGRALWRINTGTHLTAGVGTDGSNVAVAAEKGALILLDADGKQRWKVQLSSEILSAPAVGQGMVIVRSVDNKIAAFDVESGERKWSLQRTTPPLTLRSAPGIAIAGPTAYVGLPGGRLLALAVINGGLRWEAAVGDPRGATELERIADISGMPVVTAQEVCAVAYQGRAGCFDLSNGTAHWAKELSSDVGLGIDERFVFAADEHGALTAFTRDTGLSVWRNKQLTNRSLSAPVSFGRAISVGDGQGYIHFFSREDGTLIARIATDGSQITGTPVVANANLIFQTKSGTLVALAAE